MLYYHYLITTLLVTNNEEITDSSIVNFMHLLLDFPMRQSQRISYLITNKILVHCNLSISISNLILIYLNEFSQKWNPDNWNMIKILHNLITYWSDNYFIHHSNLNQQKCNYILKYYYMNNFI